MKSRNLLLTFATLLMASMALAAVPQLISLQGVLKDSGGNPVTDGSYSVIFTVYDTPSGGTVLWAETTSVSTTGGLFTALLGSVNPVPESLFFDPSRWLGITVGADPEMTPRQQLSTVGYSFVSSQWTSAAENLFRLNGNVGIGTTSPMSKLDVRGGDISIEIGRKFYLNTLGDSPWSIQLEGTPLGAGLVSTKAIIASVFGASNQGFMLRNHNGLSLLEVSGTGTTYLPGNVGIGTTSPSEKLQVVGTIHSTSGGFKFPDNSVQTTAAGASVWSVSGSDIYNNNSGDVGIGTTAPSAKLHIADTGAVELRLSPDSNNDSQDTATIRLTGENFNTGEGFAIRYSNGGDTYFDNVWDGGVNSNPAIRFRTKTAGTAINAMTLTHGGSVGIGTTSPTKKLEVAGSIKVGANDTVFSSNLSSNSPLSLQAPAGTTRMYIDDVSGNVGVGTTGPFAKLTVSTSESSTSFTGGISSYAENSSSGSAFGASFYVPSTGTGIHYGVSTGADGSSSSSAYGTYSTATNSSTGTAYGGYFSGSSTSGASYGAYATGGTYGAWGNSPSGYGVYGTSGFVGTLGSASGTFSSVYGSYGSAENTSSGDAYGGYFTTASTGSGNRYGIRASANGSASSFSCGINSTYGVYSTAENSTTNCSYGVYSVAKSGSIGTAIGGLFEAPDFGSGPHSGIVATAIGNTSSFGQTGVVANATNTTGEARGVSANGTCTSTGTAYGGYFTSSSTSGSSYGIYASGSTYAGYFVGNTTTTGTKSAAVKVNSGEYRTLYAQESPENWFEDFGKAQLVNGRATVAIEPLYAQTVNTSLEYHVFLTPEGDCRGLYVTNKTPNSFEIREQQNGKSELSVSYRIVAKRKGFENIRLAQLEGPTPEELQVEQAKRREEQTKHQTDGAKEKAWQEQERVRIEQEKSAIEKIRAEQENERKKMEEQRIKMEAERKLHTEQETKMERERKRLEEQRVKMEQEHLLREQKIKDNGENK